MTEIVVNTKDPNDRRTLLSKVTAAVNAKPGRYLIRISQYRETANDAMRRYYHVAIVNIFMQFQHDQGEMHSHDQCHEFLKDLFRPKIAKVHLLTGEVTGERNAGWSEMTTEQRSAYLENCIQFCAELGLIVQQPTHWFDKAGAA